MDSIAQYNDITILPDSNVITSTEYYQRGVTLSAHTEAMKEQAYMLCNDNFIVGGIAVLFFVLVLVIFYQRSAFTHRFKEFFSNKRLYIEEGGNENSGGALSAFLMISISALCLTTLFFNDMASLHSFDSNLGIPYWIFAVGYIACLFVIYVKAMLYGIVNWIFSTREENKRWMNGYFFLTSLTALPFYPLTLMYLFYPNSQNVVTACVIFIVILYELLLLYKLFVNFKAKIHGYMLLFLYFCSVELMPVIVIWRTFDWINNFFIVKNLIY